MTTHPIVSVKEVMVPDPMRIDGLATIRDALASMRARDISALVVDRRDAQDEFGLLLLSDIASDLISRNRPIARVNVYEVMIKPAPSVDADMHIKYAIRHMARHGFSHCVVMHGRELAGLVTLRDMTLRFVDHTGEQDE
jgi:CBS domain-containing protein